MLEWCQNEALCVLCAQRGEACIFDVPSMGSRHDTSVCLLCHASYEKCSILLECQLGEAQKTQMLGEVSVGRSVEQVGPLRSGWRERAFLAADRGKRRASPLLGAGPSKRPWGYEPIAGPPEFHIHSPTPDAALGWASSSLEPLPSITEVFLHKQVEVLTAALMAQEGELRQAREDQDAAWAEKEALEWAWNTSVRVVPERALEVQSLQERPTQQEEWPMEGVEEQKIAPEGGLLWMELEVARQREDWLANEATSGCMGILHKCHSQFSACY
ncbi:hypothetical protein C0989_006349 [Termitomyces sp. Mn162]|nr:hypothetical protein C0989_006349 [Termitomyces sp. Mn162]